MQQIPSATSVKRRHPTRECSMPNKRLRRESSEESNIRFSTINHSSTNNGYLTPCDSEVDEVIIHRRVRTRAQFSYDETEESSNPHAQSSSIWSQRLRSISVESSRTADSESDGTPVTRGSKKAAFAREPIRFMRRQPSVAEKRSRSPSSKGKTRLKEVDLKRLRRSAIEMPRWVDQDGHVDQGFRLFDRPELQQSCDKCLEDCDCSSLTCPCFKNETSCELSCKCSAASCDRRFPSCQCEDGCSSHCFCHMEGRECSDRCQCTICENWSTDRKVPKLRVQPSGIPGARAGLFAAQKILPETFIGIYEGRVVKSKGAKQNGMIMDFSVSKHHCIRADPASSLVFKINHCSRNPNIKFYVMETRSGRKPVVFAIKQILPGEELLANYGENPEFPHFDTEPLPKSPDFVVESDVNSYTYTVSPENQWHSMERVNVLKIDDTDFRVNQDVFINHSSKPPPPLPESQRIQAGKVLKQRIAHCWVGRIMEIRRRLDRPKKTYVAIAWYDFVPQSKRRGPTGSRSNTEDSFELVGIRKIEVMEGSTLSCPAKVYYVPPGSTPPKDNLWYSKVLPLDAFEPGCKDSINPTSAEEVFLNAESKPST